MRLYQVAIEQVKPREAADLTRIEIENGILTKQQLRRGLVRLFWKFEDIMIDVPLAPKVLAQLLAYLKLRGVISGRAITQIPPEIREKLQESDTFKQHFQKELDILQHEKDYRQRIEFLLKIYFLNYDDSEIRDFLDREIKEKNWDMFNYLFIRKAIDYALDKTPNEKEACSKILQMCT